MGPIYCAPFDQHGLVRVPVGQNPHNVAGNSASLWFDKELSVTDSVKSFGSIYKACQDQGIFDRYVFTISLRAYIHKSVTRFGLKGLSREFIYKLTLSGRIPSVTFDREVAQARGLQPSRLRTSPALSLTSGTSKTHSIVSGSSPWTMSPVRLTHFRRHYSYWFITHIRVILIQVTFYTIK